MNTSGVGVCSSPLVGRYERRADLLESRSLSGEEKKLLPEYVRQRDDS